MAKTFFEELVGKYERQGDYLITCLILTAEKEQAISIWGQRYFDYLKQHRKVTHTNFRTSGRLNDYIANTVGGGLAAGMALVVPAICVDLIKIACFSL